jgi:biopolymer transport protein ExbD
MKKYSRESISPDLTPLIDIIFQLLIFFLVSTMFRQDERALTLNLPQASNFDGGSNPNSLTVELTTRQLLINGTATSIDKSDDILATVENKKQTVEVRIDKKVSYEQVIKLLDKLKKHELTNLNLITSTK